MRMTFEPSGEKLKPSMSMDELVSLTRPVPSGFIFHNCPPRRKAIFVPFSIHAGSLSLTASVVRLVGLTMFLPVFTGCTKSIVWLLFSFTL